ncbi:KAT8 regulatory NSL complex subunit 1 isoform X1 [Carassius auratus]|uniref:KAT8 regulatory NSL complex subunit 1-like isoform X1 n=1 Tax=Carassius auratus TaxID=7957 RepID=A0A6P6JUL6_CARAU|nr:KAT8 regulatory NSL complex subunit 1-like isoform X1 [Carassius auratus]XP_026063564.1 KAT8 regulatory NSL complex subunit 1-like isoform X1 [Carassius auratus]
MAAMAPALTDAPAEAHRIRFKLAPSSSTLSPSGVEGSGTGNHILVSSNGAVKRKASEERPSRGAGPCKPLVTSYHCSDVSSAKESLKLQGVLLQTHSILPSLIPRKHQALDLCEEQPKSIMSASGGGGPCGPPTVQGATVNGIAKKVTKLTDQDNAVTLNGGQYTIEQDLSNQTEVVNSTRGLTSNGPLREGVEQHQPPTAESQNCPSNGEPPSTSLTSIAPFTEDKISDCPPLGSEDTLALLLAAHQDPLIGLGVELIDRTQHSQSRQGEIESRLRRLRKRLQVVQAKQVERHVQQQLGGLLKSTLGALNARRPRGRYGDDSLTPQERDGLRRFLKSGSMPAELEQLSLSCTTNLHSTECAFDSDATESSSGGETDVEEDELARVDIEQRHIPLNTSDQSTGQGLELAGFLHDRPKPVTSRCRRAEGRYAVDRAAIISHWNWLQAQVSDLEYRIRQQTDIYRQIRSSKGSVALGESSVCESVPENNSDSRTETITCPVPRELDTGAVETSVSSNGIVTETDLRKSCGPVKQVNGVINSLLPSSPVPLDPDEQSRSESQQKLETGPQASPAPDSTCVAARTRPLLSCRKRRVLRPGSLTSLNRKAQRSVAPRCGCELNAQCVMCSGRALPPADTQHQLPLLDRLAQFDPCVHPILSFTDDVMMNLHMQRVLKGHWQNRPLDKIKPIKKISLKHKLCMGSRISDPSSKDRHKLANSLLSTVRLSHPKVRSEKVFQQQLDIPISASKHDSRQPFRRSSSFDRTHGRKRPREPSLDRAENAPKLNMDMGSPCPSLSALNTPTHSPLMRQPSISETYTPLHLNSSAATIRRRRGESPFDINNIVIPMSVAATTRVEKLQYKEILTPSWREVDIFAKPISEEDDAVEIEDLSDVTFSQLHLPCEEQERSRWSWTASNIAKRRGSRSYKSVDGRTTPLMFGTNPSTPQPSSPDTPHFHMLHDYNSVTSPSSPVSPEMLMLSGLHTPGSRDSQRLQSNEDTRCSTPDTYEEMAPQPVQPWECRTFPLDVDPQQESETLHSPAGERPCRTIRRVSGCRSSKSESDAGPPSPLDDDCAKQKQSNPPKPTHR